MKTIKEFLVYIISLPSFNLKFGIAFVIAILFQFTGIAQQQWTPLDPSNIAQLKPAKQSSVHNGGAANRAVDGNTDGNWGAISVTHTQGEDSPWWEVNLLAKYKISSITIYNRTDCCPERLKNFTIRVSDQPFSGNYGGEVFGQEAQWFQGNKTFSGNMIGQYIRIHLNGRDALSLAEVVVRGEPVLVLNDGVWAEPAIGKDENLALGKKTRQSSTHEFGVSNRANDGVTEGHWGNGSVSHTQGESRPFWEVDLGKKFLVDEVKLYNRTDSYSDRLNNFNIWVTNRPFDQTTGRIVPFAEEPTNFLPETNKSYTGKKVGRYVRVQLKNSNALTLAEVKVFGTEIGDLSQGEAESNVLYKVSIFRNVTPIENSIKSSITTSVSEGMDFNRTVSSEDQKHWSLSTTAKAAVNYAIVSFELEVTAGGGGTTTNREENSQSNNVTQSTEQNTEISQMVPGGCTRYEFHKFIINQAPVNYKFNGKNYSWFKINEQAKPVGDITVMVFPNDVKPDLKATDDNWVTAYNYERVLQSHPNYVQAE
ncbi:MAG: hypothetical protein CL530_04670 [Aequorivita sp.]|nr:hypothetical protein [Aequorivita sp.]|tara:strand:+ start:221 stop:1831 length:1611 start_codon:yes stop_codon:yes gene_type:complete